MHGHTLDTRDIDGDGNLDIFAAEMARWTKKPGADYPDATAWILYGDDRGNFRITSWSAATAGMRESSLMWMGMATSTSSINRIPGRLRESASG
ncbi:MAG: hypothetical protein LC126_05015 [Bryobacterales bacterium]|nr:hypothetical protein [Bryobacterales bacterium]